MPGMRKKTKNGDINFDSFGLISIPSHRFLHLIHQYHYGNFAFLPPSISLVDFPSAEIAGVFSALKKGGGSDYL
jgi:hypothetical protein